MSKQIDALKLALEALEKHKAYGTTYPADHEAITAIKEALADLEQEPVVGTKTWFEDGKVVTQYLTAKDIYKEPEQEPVAWAVIASNTGRMCQVELDFAEVEELSPKWVVPLYITPPQRTWVELTDEEIEGCYKQGGIGRAIQMLKEKNT